MQARVMGLYKSPRIMTQNACVKFKFNTFSSLRDTNLHAKTEPGISKYKKRLNLVEIQARVMGIEQSPYIMTQYTCVKL